MDDFVTRKIANGENNVSVETTYSIAGGDKQKKVGEVLITNAQDHFRAGDLFS